MKPSQEGAIRGSKRVAGDVLQAILRPKLARLGFDPANPCEDATAGNRASQGHRMARKINKT